MNLIKTIAPFVILTMFGCGVMKKVKENSHMNNRFETKGKVEINEGMILESTNLLEQRMEKGSLVTAIIESDSIINFDPMSGFQLANGKVFYQQVAQETSAAIESHGLLIVAVLCVGLLIRLTVKYPVLRPIIGACKKRNL